MIRVGAWEKVMDVGNFKFGHLASRVFDQLPVRDQIEVTERLTMLQGLSRAKWSAKGIRKIPNEPIYLFRVNKSLRAFLRVVDGEQPEVLDIVRQELLDYMANS